MMSSIRDITKEDMVNANIGKKYWGASIFSIELTEDNENIIKTLHQVIKKIKEFYNKGLGLALYSKKHGTGKTSIAISIMKVFIVMGYSAYYIPASELLDEIIKKNTDLIDLVKNTNFLVIDNITTNQLLLNKVEEIIQHRIARTKSSVMIFDCHLFELSPKLISIVDREFIKLQINNTWKSSAEQFLESSC